MVDDSCNNGNTDVVNYYLFDFINPLGNTVKFNLYLFDLSEL